MSKRKSTPNVLAELLGPKSFDPVVTETTLDDAPIDHNTSTPDEQSASIPVSQNTVIPESQVTVTHESHTDLTPENNTDSSPASLNTGMQAKNNAVLPERGHYKEEAKAGMPVDNKDGRTESKLDEQNKEKSTYYLSKELMGELDDVWFQIRKEIGKNGRKKVSKSVIVELCIEQCIREYKESGKTSSIFREIERLVGQECRRAFKSV